MGVVLEGGAMAKRRRIALLLGQADEEYQQGFTEGVLKQCRKQNYDVCVFSMFIKYQNSKEREIGDSNIYELINYSDFDAVILLIDTIQTPGKAKEIEEKIKKSFTGPVICIDADIEGFFCFWTDGYNSVYSLISHLIEVHGFRDIAFLSGKKYHKHSQRRVDAYRAAMADHHIDVLEDRIIYGDFWYSSGASYADQLLRDKGNMPEAVACANDCMAIGLADALTREGINIPDDIAITGYGDTEEGLTSPSPLTSAKIPARYYGSYSVKCITAFFSGKNPPETAVRPELFIGCSCGCNKDSENLRSKKLIRDTWTTNTSEDGINSIHYTMLNDMMIQTTLDDFINSVYSNIYQIKNVRNYHLCLNKQWAIWDKVNQINMPIHGYSDVIVDAISYSAHTPAKNKVGLYETFPVENMLPEIGKSPEPECYIFTPLSFEEKCFGYSVVSFDNDIYGYPESYRLWSWDLCKGLEIMRREILFHIINNKGSDEALTKIRSIEDGVDQTVFSTLTPIEKRELKEVERLLDNNLFDYHFQPIVSAKTGEIYSYEALMRARSDWKLSPLAILKYAGILGRLSDVEEATFVNVLSRTNREADIFKNRKVFINSIPGCTLKNEEWEEVGHLIEENTNGVVVELTEQAELSNEDLDKIKDVNDRYGIEMAIDDYGTGYSNITNLLRYMPNYVKIDRALMSEIQNSSQKQHFVRNAIEFCHENNILALAEGIETSEELKEVIDLGVDLIQGYYTARPQLEVMDAINQDIQNEIKTYYSQRSSGSGHRKYIAGRTNRIVISNLVKDGCDTILIGDPKAIHRDLTIIGTPGNKTLIHIEVQDDYEGRITLENVFLSSGQSRPQIELGDNCNVTLELVGDNYLQNGGIMVPEGAILAVEGEGNLFISVNSVSGYGIGNDLNQSHGHINFYQDGCINMEVNGTDSVGIGSGLGGPLRIMKGRYVINMNCENGVAIGTTEGNASLDIHNCDFEANMSVNRGTCIGSVRGNVVLRVWGASIKCYASGSEMVALGTIEGKRAGINIHEASTAINTRVETCTGVGSMKGGTEFSIKMASFRAMMNGKRAVTFGSATDETAHKNIAIFNSDVNISQHSGYKREYTGSPDGILVVDTRYQASINGKEYSNP